MTKRDYDEYSHRRELQDCNFKLQKRDAVAFNSGSETLKHAVAKLISAWYLKKKGYRVDTEVEMPNGEIDVVGYAKEGAAIAVECETSPTEDIISDKLERYVHGQPIRECFIINVSEMPTDMLDALGYIQEEIGL